MDTDAVIAEILAIAEDRWNECQEELLEPFREMAQVWWSLILSAQRLHLVLILHSLHVAPRLGIFLAEHCPWRLLPKFDPDRWWAKRRDH